MNESDNGFDERIINLEEKIDRLLKDFNDRMKNLGEDKDKLDKIGIDIKEFPETINEAKREIVTFTFQLISTIIGFLSIMLAIVILWINQTKINTEMEWILVALGIAFVFLFAGFVLSWRKQHFPKMEKTSHKKIISHIGTQISEIIKYIESNNSHILGYIESNNSDMSDYIKANNSDMSNYIKEEISKCCGYTDGEISDVLEFIKKNKSK